MADSNDAFKVPTCTSSPITASVLAAREPETSLSYKKMLEKFIMEFSAMH
jgi:hypothetical protein